MALLRIASRVLLLTVAFGGCSAPSDPIGLVPADIQAIIASDRAREQAGKPAGVTEDSKVATGEKFVPDNRGTAQIASPAQITMPQQRLAADVPASVQTSAGIAAPGATATASKSSVQEILARARAAQPNPPPPTASAPAASAQGGPFVAAPVDGDTVDTPQRAAPAPATNLASSTTRTGPPTQLQAVPRTAGTQKMPIDPGLKITFAPGAKTLSTFEESKLASIVAAAQLAPGARVTLVLGPASSGLNFERVNLARRRGDAVATLLPRGLDIVQDYKPELPPDAVWLIFGASSVAESVSQ